MDPRTRKNDDFDRSICISNRGGGDDSLAIDDKIDEVDSDEDEYSDIFESIKTKTGLEIGCHIHWPVVTRESLAPSSIIELELSTCLSEECIAPMFDGTQWAGTRVWRAAVVGLQYLLQSKGNECTRPVLTPATKLLELGCGLGVPGMILHAITGCQTVLTDKDDLVQQLRQNLATNFSSTAAIQAQPLDWSIPGVEQLLSTTQWDHFDVVINTDCIYEPLYGKSWQLLLACQEELLRRHARTYVLTCCERRRADGIDLYLQAARESPVIARVEVLVIPFDHSSSIELYRLHGLPVVPCTI